MPTNVVTQCALISVSWCRQTWFISVGACQIYFSIHRLACNWIGHGVLSFISFKRLPDLILNLPTCMHSQLCRSAVKLFLIYKMPH